ncbi:MAG TPA: hypothetical protein P5227_09695 [Emcibacteraceae bacterium]|nr:hypothetical protein [Emcibacteraceae bacterium]HRW30258.1 hypothetical protein [Emcibacteraceae bacterium]
MKLSTKLKLFSGALVIGTSLIGGVTLAQDTSLSFFITSKGSGKGADLGGLAGADAICKSLATAVGQGDKNWHAYLSTIGPDGVDARDRIGSGPWYNAKGVMVARDVADLHSDNNKLSKENSLTEAGMMVNGRGDNPNMHDILTGSMLDGTAGPSTCMNWTSSGEDGSANVGHHDRQGGGANPTSWNFAHPSRGCSQPNLIATGGNGYFYCFAAN